MQITVATKKHSMVGKDLPNGKTTVGDKVVNDVKLTNLPAGRFDGQLRPYSQADVERLRSGLSICCYRARLA